MLNIRLQLFAEGGGESAGGGSDNAAGTAKGIDFESEFQKQFGRASGSAAPREEKAEAEEPAKPETDAGQDAAAETQEKDPEKDFDALIKGDYKDAFNKKVSAIINDRFKNHNAKLEAAEKRANDVMDAFAPYLEKLGLDGTDLDAVKKAAMDDRSNFRNYAVQNNMTVEEAIQHFTEQREQAKKDLAAKTQAAAAQQRQQQAEEAQQRQQIYAGWDKEADEIKKTDPDFDLKTEIRSNPSFAKALDAGLGVTFAYKATRFDNRMAQVAGVVEKQTAIKTAQKIAAGQNRPPEGGMRAQAAATSKTSYKNLSDNDFMKIFNESMKH